MDDVKWVSTFSPAARGRKNSQPRIVFHPLRVPIIKFKLLPNRLVSILGKKELVYSSILYYSMGMFTYVASDFVTCEYIQYVRRNT